MTNQVEQVSHPCAACGGSGRVPVSCDSPWHRAKLCSCNFGMDRPCPVCLGAGRISDKMPARDAVADAETLARIADSVLGAYEDGIYPFQNSHVTARLQGWLAITGAETYSDHRALLAARAAFRACLGLRGDR